MSKSRHQPFHPAREKSLRWLFLHLLLLLVIPAVRAQDAVDSITVIARKVPLFANKINNFAFTIRIVHPLGGEKISLCQVSLRLDQPELIHKVKVVGQHFINRWIDPSACGEQYLTLGSASPGEKVVIEGNLPLKEGENFFHISLIPRPDVDLTKKVRVSVGEVKLSNDQVVIPDNAIGIFRMASLVRAAGQDNVHTYRIPGLATTNKGTLIAVYDARYNNDRDLQEDIDVGMSRSTDGGLTWEPMRIIMDMGEYGGLSDSRNGIGDPAILVDPSTNVIWVAALWVHGNFASIQNNHFPQQGLDPKSDGSGSQIMLVKSEDDGFTWSPTINITKQVKNPDWDRFLQGPGKGIAMGDGTLVFPAQFLDPKQNKRPSSTIIYSKDQGTTWHTAASAVFGGSEAQVAELSDGNLMMNMRSNSKARLVSVTRDMGSTWEIHPTSGKALREPGCQASLISADIPLNGQKKRILFFSNPDHPGQRSHMTIKTSPDDGLTWPVEYQVVINENIGYGYSCLSMADQDNLGILYEGNRELYFQKIPVKDIVFLPTK